MAISKADLNKIKVIAQKFIDEHGMKKSEEDVQSSYTLQILRVLGWESDNWKINKPQDEDIKKITSKIKTERDLKTLVSYC